MATCYINTIRASYQLHTQSRSRQMSCNLKRKKKTIDGGGNAEFRDDIIFNEYRLTF